MIHKINDTQDIQEIERFIEKYPDERKEVSEVVDKVDERTDEARRNNEMIRNDAQGLMFYDKGSYATLGNFPSVEWILVYIIITTDCTDKIL